MKRESDSLGPKGQRYSSDRVGPFLRERGHQQVARLSQADARDQIPAQRGQQKLLLITMFQMVMNYQYEI